MAATGHSASRMDNAIKYASPALHGVSAELVYGMGEVAGDNAAGRQFGGALAYAGGPQAVKLAYHNRNNDTATFKNAGSARTTVMTATYDFGPAKAHLAYGTDKGVNSAPLRNATNPFAYAVAPTPSTDSADLLLGVTVPVGVQTWMASYIRKNDKTAFNQDAEQFALGYRYYLSKRTDVYTAYARIRNKNGAGYTVGSAIEGGTGDRAVNLGLRHLF